MAPGRNRRRNRRRRIEPLDIVDALDPEIERYVVVGTSGAGKSTVGRVIAEEFGHTAIDLDALHWLPDWEGRPIDEFRDLVVDTLDSHEHWVVSGNYSQSRDLIWSRAEAIVWIDYSALRITRQLLARSVRRIVSREDLWGTGNRETVRKTFASRDSILVWALETYRRRRREYPILLSQPRWSHLAVFHVTDRDVVRWR